MKTYSCNNGVNQLSWWPQAISNKDQHSISYTLSRGQTVVVEYTHDGTTDMFQVRVPPLLTLTRGLM